MSEAHDGRARLRIDARWIVPVVPAGCVLEQHALIIEDEHILDLLPCREADARYPGLQVLSLPEHMLIPGLINLHGHAAMTLFRGLADDLPLMTWLNEHIWPAETAHVSEAFVEDGVRLAMAEMIRGGTTTFSDMYFFPEVTARLAQQQHMRVQCCFPILDFPTNWGAGPDDYLRKGLALRDQYKDSRYVQIAFGPHAPYTVSDEPLTRVATLAAQLDAPIQIHVHETAFEVQDALARTGTRPLQRLEALGLLTPMTQCVHMTQIDEMDIEILRRTGAQVVHCPESNLKLASGFCPVDRLQRAGINVAIGTDGAASNNDLDLLGEIRTAALLAKAVSGDAAALDAHAALAMATLNGARALGRENELGSLEKGKLADVVAVTLDDLGCLPVYDPVSQLIYSASSRQVTHSWIGGVPHLQDGQLLRIDVEGLKTRVAEWAMRIRQTR